MPLPKQSINMIWDSLRTKFLYKSLDAVLTARMRPQKGVWENLKGVLGVGHSRYDRVGSVVGLFDSLQPGFAQRASQRLVHTPNVPFTSPSLDLLGCGSGATVFLLTGDCPVVLKVYRRTIGRRYAALLRLANEFRTKYETVASWYSEGPELVAQASFVVFHGPLLGMPAVACVQRYIDGERRDFFEGFSDRQLLDLMDQNNDLREQFVHFARVTLDRYEREGRCCDFLGNENLLLVGSDDCRRIRLIDYGILRVSYLKKITRVRLVDRFLRMQSLLESVVRRK